VLPLHFAFPVSCWY